MANAGTETRSRAQAASSLAAAAIAALVTVALFWPAVHHGYVDYDDVSYFINNRHMGPLTPGLVAWAFTDIDQVGLWIPLTWLSLGLDVTLFGAGPYGHHLGNVLLHGLTAALVAVLAVALVRRALPGAAEVRSRLAVALGAVAAALLFAVHPLRVESVAWATERKDVLCGVLALLATLAYLRFAETGARRTLAVAGALHVAAMLAKPTAMMLPLVWLVLDAHPLRRWDRARPLRVVLEKAPMLVASFAIGVVTLVAQSETIRPLPEGGLGLRLAVSGRAVVEYLALTIYPHGLYPVRFYPAREVALSPAYWLAALTAVIATATIIGLRRRAPGLAAAWVAYLLWLVPNTSPIQAGPQAMADRFTYLPSVALCVVAGGAVAHAAAWAGRRASTAALAMVLLLVVAALGTATRRQIRIWRDPLSLWTRVVEQAPESGYAWVRRARALHDLGRREEALENLGRSIAIAERKEAGPLAGLYAVRGDLLAELGRDREAFEDYTRAIERAAPVLPDLWSRRARILERLGDLEGARRDHARAATREP
jgi:hypothetical protein